MKHQCTLDRSDCLVEGCRVVMMADQGQPGKTHKIGSSHQGVGWNVGWHFLLVLNHISTGWLISLVTAVQDLATLPAY